MYAPPCCMTTMAYDTYTLPVAPSAPPPAPAVRRPPGGPLPDAYDRMQRDAMVARHAGLVRKLALRLASRLPASVDLDDLVQAGMMGLLDAVTRYREVPTAQFETYATQRIRGAMLDELRSLDWAPRTVRERGRRVEQGLRAAAQRLGRQPTEAEVAAELDIPLADYQGMLQDAHGAQLLYADELAGGLEDRADTGDEGSPLEVSSTADPLKALATQELRETLVRAIEQLPERERLLLSLCYEQGLNLKEAGLVLNVGEARVCQLRSQAIARLRASIRG